MLLIQPMLRFAHDGEAHAPYIRYMLLEFFNIASIIAVLVLTWGILWPEIRQSKRLIRHIYLAGLMPFSIRCTMAIFTPIKDVDQWDALKTSATYKVFHVLYFTAWMVYAYVFIPYICWKYVKTHSGLSESSPYSRPMMNLARCIIILGTIAIVSGAWVGQTTILGVLMFYLIGWVVILSMD